MALTEITTKSIKDGEIVNADINASADIAGSKIADNAITLAKMAGGTDGHIITYDASGDPITVGPGNDGEVLTSTGAGSPPAFESISIPAGTTINNNADNRIITGSGTANTLNGESGLTFDGSTLNFTAASGDARLTLIGTEGNDARITLSADDGDDHIDQWNIRSEAANHFAIDQFASGTFVERLTIGSDAANGDVTVKTGDLLFGTAGKGINLGVTSNTDSNTLDDYEEGTWDVVVTGAESGATSTYSDTGWYTKVGRVVHAHVKLHNVDFPGIGGLLYFSAPFAANSSIIARGGTAYWEPIGVWDDYTDFIGMSPVIAQSSSQFYLDVFRKDNTPTSQSAGSGGRNGNLTEASGVYLQFTITYFT